MCSPTNILTNWTPGSFRRSKGPSAIFRKGCLEEIVLAIDNQGDWENNLLKPTANHRKQKCLHGIKFSGSTPQNIHMDNSRKKILLFAPVEH